MNPRKPLVLYRKASEPYIRFFREVGDGVNLFPIEQDGDLPEANACYVRIGDTLRRKICLDAAHAEKRLRSRGTRILNGIATKFRAGRKDEAYAVLAAAGIRVPFRIPTPTDNEVMIAVELGLLHYPFLLRVVDSLNGIETRLILGEKDLLQSLRETEKARDRSMVCEYVETKDARGYRRKWRPYVFGGRVDQWEAGIARHWKVNLADNLDFAHEDFIADNALANWPRKWDGIMIRACEVFGLDICAFDVIETPQGTPMIVDVNETYGCTADIVERDKGIRLFDDEVREIRAEHHRRLVEWMAGL